MRENCGSCRFWSVGQCRRFPPVDSKDFRKPAGTPIYSDWPDTDEIDWCGEYQPKQKPPE